MQNEGFKYCQLLSDSSLAQLTKISVRNDIQLIWFIFNSLKGKGKWVHSNLSLKLVSPIPFQLIGLLFCGACINSQEPRTISYSILFSEIYYIISIRLFDSIWEKHPIQLFPSIKGCLTWYKDRFQTFKQIFKLVQLRKIIVSHILMSTVTANQDPTKISPRRI